MNIIKFKNIFSEEYEVIQCEDIYELLEKDKEYQIIINDNEFRYPADTFSCHEGDIINVREIPAGITGNKTIDAVIGGVAVVAGLILSPFTGGISLTLSAVGASILANTLAPEEAKSKGDLGKTTGFNKGENKALLDSPFPIIFGKHRLTPPVVGNYRTFQVQENNLGLNPTYIEGLLCLGHGKIYATDIKLGDELLFNGDSDNAFFKVEENGDYALELTHGCLPSLYNKRVTEDAIGIELKIGILAYNKDEDKMPIGFYQITHEDVTRTIPKGCKKITVNVMFANGLYHWDGGRGQYNAVAQGVAYKIHDVGAIETFKVNKLGEKEANYECRYFASMLNNQLKFTFDIDVSNFENKAITFKKMYTSLDVLGRLDYLSDDGERKGYELGSMHSVQPTITSIQYHFDETPVASNAVEKLSFLAFRILATPNRNGTLKSINMLADSKENNPAKIALNILKGKYSTRGVSDENIDYSAFKELETNTPETIQCNALVTEQMPMINLLENVLSLTKAGLVLLGSKYSVVQDKVQSVPLAILTPKNTFDFQANINTEKKPRAIKVNFFNREKNYVKEQTLVKAVSSEEVPDEAVSEVTPFGVTTEKEAYEFAKYLLNVYEHRNEVFTCTVPIYHYYLPVGSRVIVQQDILLIGLASGKIIDVKDGVVTLDEDIETKQGQQYGIQVLKGINDIVNIPVEPTNDKSEFKCSTSELSAGQVYAFGEFKKETTDCIIKSKTKISTPNLSANFELIKYNEAIFDIDSDVIEYNASASIPVTNIVSEEYKPREKPKIGDNIFSLDENGNLLISNAPVHSISDIRPPLDISSVTVQGYTNGAVRIKWTPTDDEVGGSGLAGYNVYRTENEDKSNKSIIGGTNKNDTDYDDTATTLNSTYYYGVSAYDRNNNESNITWASAITAKYSIAPAAPTNVVAKAYKGYVGITWEASSNASDVTYYEIYKNNAYLGKSGTLSFNEDIGKLEFSEMQSWSYKVRAYNVNGVYGLFSNNAILQRNGYGTYIKSVLKPMLSSVLNSITVSWEKQYELMDFKEVEIGFWKSGSPTYIKSSTFYTINNLEFNLNSLGQPIPTVFCVTIRQFATDGSSVAWQSSSFNDSSDRTLITIYPADKKIARYEQLDALTVNSGVVNSNVLKGFPTSASLPAAERYAANDLSLNYIDLTTGRFRFGDVNAYMYGDIQPQGSSKKSSIMFKSMDLELSTSDLITKADNITLKHSGRSLSWSTGQRILADANYLHIDGEISITNLTSYGKISLVGNGTRDIFAGRIFLKQDNYYGNAYFISANEGQFSLKNASNIYGHLILGSINLAGSCPTIVPRSIYASRIYLKFDDNYGNGHFLSGDHLGLQIYNNSGSGFGNLKCANIHLSGGGIKTAYIDGTSWASENISYPLELNTLSANGQKVIIGTGGLEVRSNIYVNYPNAIFVRHIDGASNAELYLNYAARTQIYLCGNTEVWGNLSCNSIGNLSKFHTGAVRSFASPAALNGFVAPSSGILVVHYVKANGGTFSININGVNMLYFLSFTVGERYTDRFYINAGDVVTSSGNYGFEAYFYQKI